MHSDSMAGMAVEEMPISDDRKAVLIGRGGSTKASIEKKTGVALSITDFVRIEGHIEGLLKAANIVKAISRGFDTRQAFRLLDEECQLDILSLGSESENSRKRLFSRIIGRKGMARKIIEKKCGVSICIYGKTISIIGYPDSIARARQAIDALLDGKTHGYAYSLIKQE